MTDYWLYSKLRYKTGEQVFESTKAYTINYTGCGYAELNLTLDASALLSEEKEEDMPIRYFNEVVRETNKELDIKKLIKTVHINGKRCEPWRNVRSAECSSLGDVIG